MPIAPNTYRGVSQPSCLAKVKFGFLMGFCVGVATGAIFGGFNCLRYGLRGRELIQTVGKGMFQGGGTFGMFMAIGTAIRC
ncbi:unnamed protein product [Schistosoma guineensis]|uniref:Reactive oxygen species modulator 1 n=3 Tax=Schistosoma TaxID=6181 RepID=A0A183KDM1_9TREM|nr:uncharacterized protein DC041_0009420 [Schistosoma bovis]CAH8591297.1 unnamed protein product [Schistosoma mattheei]CAH8600631.1 unnamed protein product [Schistosoma intercalatum]CAH8613913.1 unnamed protein product [Schistosoma guineensis]CAH8618403.1 unnamed protein product [Schistosoma curassoni]